MKVLLLAAGYATRMYPLTRNRAKPLLEVGGRPMLSHLLDRVTVLPDVTEVLVVANHPSLIDTPLLLAKLPQADFIECPARRRSTAWRTTAAPSSARR